MSYPDHLRAEVDEYLATFTFDATGGTEGLAEAMRYSLLAGGKRIRPVLALATARAVDVDEPVVMPLAAALELVHTYSLIHDDLPAMDDDDLRRGRPTCHKVYGESVAILAGDALYAEAFRLLLGLEGADASGVLRAARELADATAVAGMVGGQYLDVAERAQAGAEGLRQLHVLKTGRLIAASVRCVLLLKPASGSDSATISLSNFADEVGVLFQIVDDILDVTGSEAALGKPTGSDERHGKRTYVSEHGLENARKLATESYQRALSSLDELSNADTDELRAIADFMFERSS